MLNRLIAFSLGNRLLVLLLALAIAVLGTITAIRLPVDVLPDLNRPTVTILTEAHGLVPQDVEQLVSRPVEQSVSGATGVMRVRSTSGLGLSVVYVEFDWDMEIYRARQIVQERLQIASASLPDDVVPQMAPISSVMGQVQMIGLRSKSGAMDATEIRAFADQTVKLRLLGVPGVAQVVSIGGAPRQLQVIVDVDRLRAHDVALEELAEAIGAANENASGGIMDVGTRGTAVSVTGLLTSAADLAQAVVRDDPVRPVLVGDVARVEFGPAAIRTGDAGVNGQPGVVLVVFKQPDVDTVKLAERVDRVLAEIAASAGGDLEILPGIYRQAEFIERAVDNVIEALLDGSILVVIVLFLFLANFRTTLITLTAIPLSVAVTALVFMLFGQSINTMTLGGLAVAIGALVDDAIVGVENVFRRLRENQTQIYPRSGVQVVFRAVSEVRSPVLIGTLVVAAVYLPLFALSGMEGRLFTPIGAAYIVSILASLLVSMSVTPVLCAYLLPNSRAIEKGQPSAVVRALQSVAEKVIRLSLSRTGAVSAAFAGLLVLAVFALGTRGTEFLPPFNEGVVQVNLVLPPGTGLTTSNAFGRRLEESIVEIEGVAGVGRRTGRAEGDEHAEGVNVTEMIVSFDPESERSRDEILADVRERMHDVLPGASTSAEQPLAHLLSHLLSGVSAQVAIKVFGDDLPTLRRAAAEVTDAIRPIDGVTDLMVEPQVLVERVQVDPRRTRLARLGLTVEDVAHTVELALEGSEVSRLVQGRFSYPIVLRLEEDDRRDLPALRNLLVEGESHDHARLGDVADVTLTRTPNGVKHENASRRIVVQHNVEGRSLGEVVADVERALAGVRATLPPGYSIRVGGQFQAQRDAQRVIGVLSVLSLLVMIGLITTHFRSVRLALFPIASIPMAFVGASALVVITGQTVSIATLVGLVSLGGIAARNNILLIDHYLHLMAEEGESFSKEMIVRAGRERVVPVLMTALTTGVALIPLVLSPGEPGRELLYPVASVIVGGLISTTLLDVLLTPGLFWTFAGGMVGDVVKSRAGERAEVDRYGEALAGEEARTAEPEVPDDVDAG